jgi:hypothetical protein
LTYHEQGEHHPFFKSFSESTVIDGGLLQKVIYPDLKTVQGFLQAHGVTSVMIREQAAILRSPGGTVPVEAE